MCRWCDAWTRHRCDDVPTARRRRSHSHGTQCRGRRAGAKHMIEKPCYFRFERLSCRNCTHCDRVADGLSDEAERIENALGALLVRAWRTHVVEREWLPSIDAANEHALGKLALARITRRALIGGVLGATKETDERHGWWYIQKSCVHCQRRMSFRATVLCSFASASLMIFIMTFIIITSPTETTTTAPVVDPYAYKCNAASLNAEWTEVAACDDVGTCLSNGTCALVESGALCLMSSDACDVEGTACTCSVPQCLIDTTDAIIRGECSRLTLTCVGDAQTPCYSYGYVTEFFGNIVCESPLTIMCAVIQSEYELGDVCSCPWYTCRSTNGSTLECDSVERGVCYAQEPIDSDTNNVDCVDGVHTLLSCFQTYNDDRTDVLFDFGPNATCDVTPAERGFECCDTGVCSNTSVDTCGTDGGVAVSPYFDCDVVCAV